jgi:hypothetical protein
MHTTFQSGDLKEGYRVGNLGVNATIILEGYRLDSSGWKYGPVTDFCDHNNELSFYITAGEFY